MLSRKLRELTSVCSGKVAAFAGAAYASHDAIEAAGATPKAKSLRQALENQRSVDAAEGEIVRHQVVNFQRPPFADNVV
jgi:hypothetical protein